MLKYAAKRGGPPASLACITQRIPAADAGWPLVYAAEGRASRADFGCIETSCITAKRSCRAPGKRMAGRMLYAAEFGAAVHTVTAGSTIGRVHRPGEQIAARAAGHRATMQFGGACPLCGSCLGRLMPHLVRLCCVPVHLPYALLPCCAYMLGVQVQERHAALPLPCHSSRLPATLSDGSCRPAEPAASIHTRASAASSGSSRWMMPHKRPVTPRNPPVLAPGRSRSVSCGRPLNAAEAAAAAGKPVVIFLDEIDALCPARSASRPHEARMSRRSSSRCWTARRACQVGFPCCVVWANPAESSSGGSGSRLAALLRGCVRGCPCCFGGAARCS